MGATIDVPTLDGPRELTIPAGTQGGDVFKMPGFGMPSPRRRGRGDLLVQVAIEVPTRLDEEQEDLLRRAGQARTCQRHAPAKELLREAQRVFCAPG